MSASALVRPAGFRHVVVATGHVTDAQDRATARFPEHGVRAVERVIGELFAHWQLDARDLVICGGARGADLVSARCARERGATPWLLLASAPETFEQTSVAGADPSWIEQFWTMVQRAPSWVLERDSRFGGRQDVFAAANEWMFETATTQAGGSPVRLVAVWDGAPAAGAGGTAHMVEVARAGGAEVVVVDPLSGRAAADGSSADGTSADRT